MSLLHYDYLHAKRAIHFSDPRTDWREKPKNKRGFEQLPPLSPPLDDNFQTIAFILSPMIWLFEEFRVDFGLSDVEALASYHQWAVFNNAVFMHLMYGSLILRGDGKLYVFEFSGRNKLYLIKSPNSLQGIIASCPLGPRSGDIVKDLSLDVEEVNASWHLDVLFGEEEFKKGGTM